MSDALEVRPRVEVTAAYRKASSSCCGDGVAHGATPDDFTCRDCGQPCERVLAEPEEVIFLS